MTTVIIGAALLALSTVSLSQSLNNNFPFKVLTEDFPPYNYQKNGINKGIAVDTLLHIVKAAGYAIENKNIRQIPWGRALLMTKSSPEVMLFSTARLPEREGLFRWVGPIDTLGNVVIGLKQRNITLKSVEDIHRYKVGVIRTMPREILDSAGFTLIWQKRWITTRKT